MNTQSTPSVDLAGSIEAARAAQRAWAELPIKHRLEPVSQFRTLLVSSCDRLVQVIAQDVGKWPVEVLGGEVLPVAAACRFLQREASRLLRPRRISGWQRPLWLFGQSDVVHRRPRGVVGIIGTWNYPLFLNGIQILQALTAGNAVVWKPSEVAPRFAEVLCDLLRQAGFPRDLVQCLPATREMGSGLAESAIDHVVFTGSAGVGRKLGARLGERLISSTMELSGCDMQLVLDDADVDLAARAAWFGATMNRGQTCTAVRRALVQRRVYPAFSDALRKLADQAQPVRLALSSQVMQVRRLIDEAIQSGARLLTEGSLNYSGRECSPAVVVDARPDMAICREASFAPVMAVIPFDTVEEALRMDRCCPCALGASIFTGNLDLAAPLAAQLRAGCVTINDVIVPMAHPATPFGGRDESGWGVTQGAEGLLEMTVPQVVSVRAGRFRPHYDISDPQKLASQEELLRGLLDATHAPTIGARLRGWWRVLCRAWRGL